MMQFLWEMTTFAQLSVANNELRMMRSYLILMVSLALFFAPQIARAQVLFELPECAKTTGDCQLGDAVNTLINVAEFIFGIAGSLTLLMFMYGGFMWVTSGGSASRVSKGKDIIFSAIVGLLIVFLSAAVVQYALKAFNVDQQFNLLQGKPSETIIQGAGSGGSGSSAAPGSANSGTSDSSDTNQNGAGE